MTGSTVRGRTLVWRGGRGALAVTVVLCVAFGYASVPALASSLPDGRAWELVSPPDKHGAGIEPITLFGGVVQAAEDGGAITYVSTNPPVVEPPGNRAFETTQLLSSRTSAGWSTQDIATPHSEVGGFEVGRPSEYQWFSPDLALGLVEPRGETPLSPTQIPGEVQEQTLYLHDDAPLAPAASEAASYAQAKSNGEAMSNQGYLALATKANIAEGAKLTVGTGNVGERLEVRYASPDLSHVVFFSPEPLTIGGEVGREKLYEWGDGKLSFIGNGEPGAGYLTPKRHAVSNDGSRVIFTAGSHLYMRDNAMLPASPVEHGECTVPADACTIEVDAPDPGGEAGGEHGARPRFQTASSDGSKVFFTDEARLTGNSTAHEGSGPEQKSDLYVFEVTSGEGEALAGRLTDLTVNLHFGEDGESAAVQGNVVGASENGSYVYFVANGVLGDGGEHGATPGDCNIGKGTFEEEEEETCSLYLERYEAGGWEAPRFIATLSREDEPDWGGGGDGTKDPALWAARVSPDGRWLAFMSDRSLTGYDNVDVSEVETPINPEEQGVRTSVHHDQEVYLYDAETGGLVCASCNPTGARPVGVFDPNEDEPAQRLLVDEREAWSGHWLGGSVPGYTSVETVVAFYQSRYLSNGGRLFFDSPDALVPADVDGEENVYESEPEGLQPEGAVCDSETQGASEVFKREAGGAGCVGLISSGGSPKESAFLDASESGADVFFLTEAQLVPADQDSAYDVYDAHVCTSVSPCVAPTVPVSPSPCEAETSEASCKPPAVAEPAIFGVGPTETIAGAGNLAPVPAPLVAKAVPRTAAEVRADKLAKALRACKKVRAKKKRVGCEKRAREKYGPAKAKKAGSERGASR
jgi:hypothetical protein